MLFLNDHKIFGTRKKSALIDKPLLLFVFIFLFSAELAELKHV